MLLRVDVAASCMSSIIPLLSFSNPNFDSLLAVSYTICLPHRIAPKLAAVVVSHSDLHHAGGLGILYGTGNCHASLFLTVATHRMTYITLYSTWFSLTDISAFSSYNLDAVDRALRLRSQGGHTTPLRYAEPVTISGFAADGHSASTLVTIEAAAAGHDIGGSVWLLHSGAERVVYCPAWNHGSEATVKRTALLDPPLHFRQPTALIADARPAAHDSVTAQVAMDTAVNEAQRTVNGGGNVLIAAPPAGRVLELLVRLEAARWPDECTVAYVGHMAQAVAAAAKTLLEWGPSHVTTDFVKTLRSPFLFRRVRLVNSVRDLVGLAQPMVVVANVDTMDFGPAKSLFLEWAVDSRAAVVLFGTPARGTLASQLLERGALAKPMAVTVTRRIALTAAEIAEAAAKRDKARAADRPGLARPGPLASPVAEQHGGAAAASAAPAPEEATGSESDGGAEEDLQYDHEAAHPSDSEAGSASSSGEESGESDHEEEDAGHGAHAALESAEFDTFEASAQQDTQAHADSSMADVGTKRKRDDATQAALAQDAAEAAMLQAVLDEQLLRASADEPGVGSSAGTSAGAADPGAGMGAVAAVGDEQARFCGLSQQAGRGTLYTGYGGPLGGAAAVQQQTPWGTPVDDASMRRMLSIVTTQQPAGAGVTAAQEAASGNAMRSELARRTAPARTTATTVRVTPACRVVHVHYDAFADMRTMRNVYEGIAPHQMLLGAGVLSSPLQDAMLAQLAVLPCARAGKLAKLSAPGPVDISTGSSSTAALLTSGALTSTPMVRIGEYELGWIRGEVEQGANGALQVLPPSEFSGTQQSAVTVPGYPVVLLSHEQVRISSLRQRLAGAGVAAQFEHGQLVTKSGVRVQRRVLPNPDEEQGGAKVVLEVCGPLCADLLAVKAALSDVLAMP